MDKQQSISMIEALSNSNGASGFEDEVAAVLEGYTKDLGAATQDSMRNLLVSRNGNTGEKPQLMLDAHTDEVGFMVQTVKPNGMLQFIPLGGWVAANVAAQKVRVRTRDGSYTPGIVSSKPPHFLSEGERKAPPALEQMSIDVLATSAAEAKEVFGIRPGEPVVPDVAFSYMDKNDTMTGKAFDCRIGCAALVDTLRELAGEELNVDITAAFDTQEELGLRGARVTANRIAPDVAIVFEGAPADDTFADGASQQCALKKGPMIRFIDSTILTNPRFMRLVLDVAEEKGIPVQPAVRTTGGTNAGAIHLAAQGVPVIVLAIPVRYIHAHHGVAAWEDYEATVRLAAELIRRLDKDTIAGL